MLSFWAKTSGTWINVALVLVGTGCGLVLRDRLSPRLQAIITQAVGLTTIFIGISMAATLSKAQAGQVDGVILALLALVIGGLLGEWWQLEKQLILVGDWLKTRFKGGNRFTEGFVAASLLFCIGPMAILGSLNNGLLGDSTVLVVKSTMDGLVSIALTGTYGLGVGCSVIPLWLYQGGLSLLANSLAAVIPDPATAPSILLVSGIGGIMILGLGLNLLNVQKIQIASFLPALALGPLVSWLAQKLLP
ncbi:MAG: putative membrane protein, possible Na+ channel or pump [Phormidesmis priestleyi Ana]|uniref:Putative membrane protein, possible Na+ channel or pump n=1 Tax=Phormidesmis priestleyi Ana TaxID=1666911 RepID=A0A0P8DJW1_9CYAN|nr:MAG: putative membrane protein, possible Na+ channel or pump [Phormidesmis priestleyi Ana]